MLGIQSTLYLGMNQLHQFSIILLVSTIFFEGSLAIGDAHFISPTGFKIPVDTINAALPHALRKNAQDHIYDEDSNGNIHGPNEFKLNLSDESQGYYNSIESHSSLYVTLNGQHINHNDDKHTKLKTHGRYKAVYSGTTKRLLAVWGPQLHLLPVHHSKHPFVFVNSYHQEEEGEEVNELVPSSPGSVGNDTIVERIRKDGNRSQVRQSSTECASGIPHYVEIVAAFDSEFCAMFGTDERSAISVIQAAVDIAGVPFRDQTCIRLVLVGVEANCDAASDPYAYLNGMSELAIFTGFTDTFSSNHVGLNRDVAILFSGFADSAVGSQSYGSAGVTPQGNLCGSQAYIWVEKVTPAVLAHMFGHSMTLVHTGSGLMTPFYSSDDFFFDPFSIQILTSYIDNSPPCLTTTPPVCDSTCPNQCVNNKCIANTAPNSGLISCVPASHYDCAGSTFTSGGDLYGDKVDCPSGYEYVEKTYDPTDPELVCCSPSTDVTTADAVSTLFTRIEDPLTSGGTLYSNPIFVFSGSSIATTTFVNTQMVPCLVTPTPSPSVTPSVTPSTSPSITMTPSISPSGSVSTTPSSSMTLSASPSVTMTPSISPSGSVSTTPPPSTTSSSSPSVTMTPSTSSSSLVSTIPSPITTSSTSSSVTVAPSQTPSSSVSTTSSPSTTLSTSLSVTMTPSVSPSGSVTTTPSPSPTSSASPSTSASTTTSQIQSSSVSITPSPSSILSSSPSTTDSPPSIPSSSANINAPPMQTVSSSPSSTPSPSPTQSSSISISPSQSTISATLAPSLQSLPSAAPSISVSMTSSPSYSPVITIISSPTPSFSVDKNSSPSMKASASGPVNFGPSLKPSSSVSMAIFPSSSSSSSPSISPPLQPAVCGDSFSLTNHVMCRTRLKRTIDVRNVGNVKVVFRARFGTFSYFVRALNGTRIRRFGMITSTASRVRNREIRNVWTRYGAKRKVSGIHDMQISEVPLVSPVVSCCGGDRFRIFFGVRLCNDTRSSCRSTFRGFAIGIRCGQVCPSNAMTGTPMGPGQRCPAC